MTGCGCKICNANLGDYANDLISSGESLSSVIKLLEHQGLKVSKKVLKNHLFAYEIQFFDDDNLEVVDTTPVEIDLNEIDFSEYNFDLNDPEEVIAYIQKIALKLYFNQSKITLQAQQDTLNGSLPGVPITTVKNLDMIHRMLDKSIALGVRVNQHNAIKVVEEMGLTITNKQLLSSNVSTSTDTQTDQ